MQEGLRDNLDRIYLEWKKFIETGAFDTDIVRTQISQSWLRNRQAGIDPYSTQVHSSLSEEGLSKILKNNKRWIQVARPVMANLHKFVQGSGFVVALTNANGHIMEMFCDDDTKQNHISQNFFPGASWSEDEVGTNAIGTALVTQQPIQVSGAEHFCQKLHGLTCSSAPIFSCKGEIIGILDMSGESQASHLHTMGIVVAAAEAIMAQLRIQQKNYELATINNRLTNFFNKVSDAVFIVDKEEVIIEYNPIAKAMFDKPTQNIIGLPVNTFIDSSAQSKKLLGDSYTDIEVMADTKDGHCYCLASGEPIVNEHGEVTGGFIVLRPIKQVQKLVNRVNGYYATLQFNDIIGESEEIREVIRLARLTTSNTSNLLLQGESGTGKEIFAQAIHNQSLQNSGPFIPLNCGAIPRELIGSELFGYEEGAFTGAKRGGRIGKFELASGGTLFLDEIGDMPLEQQTALLRVIQEKKVARIGSDKIIPVNVRLICATNKDLIHEVEKGTFRKDLFYRLNVMPITIPPLRNRIIDIPLLFRHFLENLSRDWGYKFAVEPEVIECLMRYSWPGNVREMQNVVERAANLAEDRIISVSNLPEEVRYPSKNETCSTVAELPQTLNCRQQRQNVAGVTEKHKILSLLNMHGGNVSRVAKELGVSRKTVYNKMRMYSIQN